jgi:hypothetical protein
VFTGALKLVRKPTGYEKKPAPHRQRVCLPTRADLPRTIRRVSDPQIPLTRRVSRGLALGAPLGGGPPAYLSTKKVNQCAPCDSVEIARPLFVRVPVFQPCVCSQRLLAAFFARRRSYHRRASERSIMNQTWRPGQPELEEG